MTADKTRILASDSLRNVLPENVSEEVMEHIESTALGYIHVVVDARTHDKDQPMVGLLRSMSINDGAIALDVKVNFDTALELLEKRKFTTVTRIQLHHGETIRADVTRRLNITSAGIDELDVMNQTCTLVLGLTNA